MKRYISLYRTAFLRKVIPISGIIVIVSSLQLNNKRTRETRIHDCLNSSGIVLVKQISKLFSDVDQLLFLTRPRRFHTDPITWRSVTNSAPLWGGGFKLLPIRCFPDGGSKSDRTFPCSSRLTRDSFSDKALEKSSWISWRTRCISQVVFRCFDYALMIHGSLLSDLNKHFSYNGQVQTD